MERAQRKEVISTGLTALFSALGLGILRFYSVVYGAASFKGFLESWDIWEDRPGQAIKSFYFIYMLLGLLFSCSVYCLTIHLVSNWVITKYQTRDRSSTGIEGISSE